MHHSVIRGATQCDARSTTVWCDEMQDGWGDGTKGDQPVLTRFSRTRGCCRNLLILCPQDEAGRCDIIAVKADTCLFPTVQLSQYMQATQQQKGTADTALAGQAGLYDSGATYQLLEKLPVTVRPFYCLSSMLSPTSCAASAAAAGGAASVSASYVGPLSSKSQEAVDSSVLLRLTAACWAATTVRLPVDPKQQRSSAA